MKGRVAWACALALAAQIALLLLWACSREADHRSNEAPPTAQGKDSIFVYNWPQGLINAWPSRYSHPRLAIERFHAEFDGAGPMEDRLVGLHRTHQYALFPLFLRRLYQSPLRTSTPDRASFFFIPYDLGMDASARFSDGALVSTSCPRQQQVRSLLASSPAFLRSNGSDHFLLISINQMMVFFNNRACRQLLKLCYNCIKLAIDGYSPEVYSDLGLLPELTNRWYSIPFPSNFHRSPSTVEMPWEALRRGPKAFLQARPISIAYLGSDKITARVQRRLRKSIVAACEELPSECKVQELTTHSSNAMLSLDLYRQARFCLIPGGDYPTRKAFVDAMLSGCIPVTFHPATALEQWSAHWGSQQRAEDCIVHFPLELAVRDMQHVLNSIVAMSRNETALDRRLQCIAAVAERFQYSLPMDSALDFSRQLRHGPDAFDVALSMLHDGDVRNLPAAKL